MVNVGIVSESNFLMQILNYGTFESERGGGGASEHYL